MMLMLIIAGFALVSGIGMTLWPERRAGQVERRIAEGDDRHFEEQRTYAAYPKLRDPRAIRRTGQVLIACGLVLLLLLWIGET